MKKIFVFITVAAGVMFAACNQKPAEAVAEGEENAAVEAQAAPAPQTLKDVTPTKGQIDSVSYLVGIQFGSFIKGYNFGDLNMAQIKKGMMDFINSKGNQRDPDFVKQFKVNPEEMNNLFNNYLEKRQAYMGLQNKEKGEKYMAANKKKAGVEVTESGLQYKIIEPGNPDLKAGPTDTVLVRYKGTLLDGTVFDETKEDADPVRLTLDRVIKGWQEGLQLVGEGGKIQLVIPSDLGYGERGTQGIEPNSALLFDVDVVEVHKFIPKVEEETPAE
ncbi:MAG: FKBP-type peptidyl-prolyl cis-trans isomerase [Bacteroidales bacterium]|nr:FKBP-type peptidyl-prolyl cis-trans isomerase [Bacteroidales bacterium]